MKQEKCSSKILDTMTHPTVSIIMPLYNAERFVEQSIRSVISQTYKDWELIVVDDCSTDSSVAIVEHLVEEDKRIKLFHTDRPSGSPTTPRNIAIQNAKGRYIAFLDSDDMWLPKKLEEQLPLFEDDDTKVVFSYYKKMDEDGNVRSGVVTSPDKADYRCLLNGNVIGNLTGIYDTKKVGKQQFDHIGHEDYVCWLRILRGGGYAVNTKRVHAIYRLTSNSLSRNKLKVLMWQWRIYRQSENLGLLRSLFCFACYSVKGIKKALV